MTSSGLIASHEPATDEITREKWDLWKGSSDFGESVPAA